MLRELNPRFLVTLAIPMAAIFMLQGAPADDAPKHANFSGRWRMIKDQSDFGTFQKPDIVVRVVEQQGSTMNVHTVQTTGSKTSISDVSYVIDGSETTNVMSGRNASSKTFWDGSALMVRTSTTDSKHQPVEMVDRWELSPDGQLLTITSDVTAPHGEAHLKLVCEKEKTGS